MVHGQGTVQYAQYVHYVIYILKRIWLWETPIDSMISRSILFVWFWETPVDSTISKYMLIPWLAEIPATRCTDLSLIFMYKYVYIYVHTRTHESYGVDAPKCLAMFLQASMQVKGTSKEVKMEAFRPSSVGTGTRVYASSPGQKTWISLSHWRLWI